jgi:hypothetical protein
MPVEPFIDHMIIRDTFTQLNLKELPPYVSLDCICEEGISGRRPHHADWWRETFQGAAVRQCWRESEYTEAESNMFRFGSGLVAFLKSKSSEHVMSCTMCFHALAKHSLCLQIRLNIQSLKRQDEKNQPLIPLGNWLSQKMPRKASECWIVMPSSSCQPMVRDGPRNWNRRQCWRESE